MRRILLLVLLLTPASIIEAEVLSTCPDQCGGYSNIQAVINEAENGDTVLLEEGAYTENIVINKSIALMGSGSGTFLVSSGRGPVISVVVDNVTVSSLSVGYAVKGVEAVGCRGLLVEDCIFVNNSVGVSCVETVAAEVRGCSFSSNSYGCVTVMDSVNTSISSCGFSDCELGVGLMRSGGNKVTENMFNGVSEALRLDSSHENRVEMNRFIGVEKAVLLVDSSGNTVSSNVCVNTSTFIGAYLSSKNLFQDNNATGEVFAKDSYSYDNSYWFGEAFVSGSFFNLGLLGGEAPSGYRGRSPVFNLTFTGDIREGEAVVVYPVEEEERLDLYRLTGDTMDLASTPEVFNGSLELRGVLSDSGLYRVLEEYDTVAPVARFECNSSVTQNSTMFFDASASTDNVGVVEYRWDFGDGVNGVGETAYHRYDEVGEFNVSLRVLDGMGNVDTVSRVVSVVGVETVDEGGGSRWLYVGLIVIFAGIVGMVYARMRSTEGYM